MYRGNADLWELAMVPQCSSLFRTRKHDLQYFLVFQGGVTLKGAAESQLARCSATPHKLHDDGRIRGKSC